MNSTQGAGVLRIVITAIGAVLAVLGYAKGIDWLAVSSTVTPVVMALWSWHANKTKALVTAVASAIEVHPEVVKAALIKASPSPKATAAIIGDVK